MTFNGKFMTKYGKFHVRMISYKSSTLVRVERHTLPSNTQIFWIQKQVKFPMVSGLLGTFLLGHLLIGCLLPVHRQKRPNTKRLANYELISSPLIEYK